MWSLKGCQSVSRTAAVWPRNRGIWSGILPRSLTGMTANAPPPLDSQLTERYSGLAYFTAAKVSWEVLQRGAVCVVFQERPGQAFASAVSARALRHPTLRPRLQFALPSQMSKRTFTKFVSQALRLMWRLS
jgi:hypothetical protein